MDGFRDLEPSSKRAQGGARLHPMKSARTAVRSETRTDRGSPHVVILSGLSGGGKTAAAKLCEDVGFTVVDNLPGELLPALAGLVSAEAERFAKLAIVMIRRSGR
jgi:hypothetical protein